MTTAKDESKDEDEFKPLKLFRLWDQFELHLKDKEVRLISLRGRTTIWFSG